MLNQPIDKFNHLLDALRYAVWTHFAKTIIREFIVLVFIKLNDMKIIDNYKHLPIGLYEQIQEINRQDDIDDLHKQVLTIAVLTGKEAEEIYSLPIEEYTELAKKSLFLTREYEGDVRVAQVYKVKGWELVPVKDYKNINTAQYIDFQTFSKLERRRWSRYFQPCWYQKGRSTIKGTMCCSFNKIYATTYL